MSYKHDIFISYKWGGDIKEWVDTYFIPLLERALRDVKGTYKKGDIFHDIEVTKKGAFVPAVLRDGVANSKCMICVISKSYFTDSTWCPSELSAMLKREEETGIRNNPGHVGLIFPVIFVKPGADTPEAKSLVYRINQLRELFTNILTIELDERKFYRIGGGFKDTQYYDELRFIIRDFVQDSILPLIETPPEWSARWNEEENFVSRFNLHNTIQNFPLPRL